MMAWRVRIFSPQGSTAVGGFTTEEDAVTAQRDMNATYLAHPHLQCTTVLELYLPTRPLRDVVQACAQQLKAQLGETDPIVRMVAGQTWTSPQLTAYDALKTAAKALSAIVYEEEGKY